MYIDNVVKANLLAAHAASDVSGRVFNVATGQRTTLLQAYEAVQQITGHKGAPNFQPERAGDIRHSLADISLAQKALGYQPTVEFRQGLEQTISWYREAPLVC